MQDAPTASRSGASRAWVLTADGQEVNAVKDRGRLWSHALLANHGNGNVGVLRILSNLLGTGPA